MLPAARPTEATLIAAPQSQPGDVLIFEEVLRSSNRNPPTPTSPPLCRALTQSPRNSQASRSSTSLRTAPRPIICDNPDTSH